MSNNPLSPEALKVPSTTEGDVLITRVFDAPRAAVFAAWSEPEALKQWYAPKGCTTPYCTVDFRAGGMLHHCIATPGGDCWCKGEYLEIVVPERIVHTLRFSDAQGNEVVTPPEGKHADWPMETTVTLTFAEHEGKTHLTLHQTVSEALAKHTGAHPSWLEMLDRLDVLLASTTDTKG